MAVAPLSKSSPGPLSDDLARPRTAGTARRRLFADRLARLLVSAGGIAIILGILGILIFIVVEIWPLTQRARVAPQPAVAISGRTLGALVTDEYRTYAVGIGDDGNLAVVRLSDGQVVADEPFFAAPPDATVEPSTAGAMDTDSEVAATAVPLRSVAVVPGEPVLTAVTGDGRVLARRVAWEITFEGSVRQVTPVVAPVVVFPLADGQVLETYAARLDESGRGVVAAWTAAGELRLMRREVTENLLTGEVTEEFEGTLLTTPEPPTVLVVDGALRNLYGGTASGRLLWWDLPSGNPEPQVAESGPAAVSALSLLIGDRSLLVGKADGTLSVWFPVRQADESFRLTQVRDFPPHPGAVEHLSPSMRNKGFVAFGGGQLGLYHSTSHRVLWRGGVSVEEPRAVALAPRGDGILIAGEGQLARFGIKNPHPEVTWSALFGRVWYEGYDQPEYVWQSTGGSDNFEPKLSLTPLLIGTLKGTFYSLLLAIPLGVFGAMYLSQFMHPVYQRYVKPTVEIMAALPTVVLGFLAGLWLAPRLERAFPALVLMFVLLPLLVLGAGALWSLVPRRIRGRFPVGVEALFFVGVLAVGIWVCLELSPMVELALFDGSFPAWLKAVTGLTYDQRNAIVVGLAMGFAVIPIIFAISEDAFSNVPRNLVSGALALGASRWQTVTRVVLPTASPGIFSAVMIGFGRAVGETMIVLMATGNTPVMDWSPFNGFRTLSANIAVEIPEAPVGGTLYRTLFLAALVLFVLTFAVNTVAEVVRQRLRRRYSRL
jgi:phosphate transport system permease protein